MRIPYPIHTQQTQQKGGTAVTPNTISELLAAILPILPNATLDEDNIGQIIIYTDLTTQGDDTLVPFAVCDCCGLPEDTLYEGAAGARLCDECSEQEGAR